MTQETTMGDWYAPDGSPISVDQLGNYENRVAETKVHTCSVSTVWLGLDHRFGDGPPLIFETMIFGGPHDQWQDRYSTQEAAQAGHDRVVAWLEDEGPWCETRFNDRICHLPPHEGGMHRSWDYDGRVVAWQRQEDPRERGSVDRQHRQIDGQEMDE